MTTPKTLAREVDAYGQTHPNLHLRIYEVPQIPGTLPRSRPIRGAAESLITNRLYFTVVLILEPELMLTDWIIYEKRGKYSLGYDATAISPTLWQPLDVASSPTAGSQRVNQPIVPISAKSPDPSTPFQP